MRFAFITPRYGADITSGPEHACRLLAEQVSVRHDVDVLTTCAHDPRTWKNEYPEGTDRMRGVLVRRFPASHLHDAIGFEQHSARLRALPRTRADEIGWSRRLGPQSNGLIEYLRRQHRNYDALIFFSLLHATTVDGAQIAPERTIVFPYLQLVPALRFGLWTDLLSSVKAIGLVSDAERELLFRYIGVAPGAEETVGIGIEPPPQLSYPRHQQDPADAVTTDDLSPDASETDDGYLSSRGVTFRRRHRLYGAFALYGGRVESDNGCEEMLEYFESFAEADGEMPLVLLGVKLMKVPESPHVRLGGVLPDRERMAAFEAADVAIVPAPDDLLAQSTLESLAVGTPVLTSARNAAAVEHCAKANGGLYYGSREEFAEGLHMLAHDPQLRAALGENGRNYVRQHHRWEHALGRFERLVGRVRARP